MPAQHAPRRGRSVPVLLIAILLVGLASGYVLAARPFHEPPARYNDARHFLPALWPEQWRGDLLAAQRRVDDGSARWRLRPEETALRFARIVMQWPAFHRLEVCDGDLSAYCKRDGTHFAISRTGTAPPLIVSLDQLGRSGDSGAWSVTSVQGPRVFIDLAPGDTFTFGEHHVATTTLPSDVEGYLRTGSSYIVVPGGCGSGGGRRAKIEDGTIELRPALAAVQCRSDENSSSVMISTGERLRKDAVGFVFVALDHDGDSIGYAMDAQMPAEIRDSFIHPGPILELAAVPVYFSAP